MRSLSRKRRFDEALGKNKGNREQYQQFQYKKFNEDWIVDIESFLPSIDKITRNLKSSLRYEEEVLPVEKTRRISNESIRHLLRNTRYIKTIDENDGVVPEKILNTLSEIDYGIYENRFIMTLIERLNDYLVRRLDIIKNNLHGSRETYYNFRNEFYMDRINFGININMIAIEGLDLDQLDLHNHFIYERTLEVYEQVTRLYKSDFMRTMKAYPRVKPPIMKTQIILSNPDFRNAYLLWLYLDRIHVLDYTMESETRTKEIDQRYHLELDNAISNLLTTIYDNSNFGRYDDNDDNVNRISTEPMEFKNMYVGNLELDDVSIYDLEPNLASEHFLSKMKEQLDEKLERIRDNHKAPKQNLKQVLLDQYSIGDQIFNHYYENHYDRDGFSELMKHRDPVKKYHDAYEKYLITKAASEVKARLYKESLELELKWLRDLERLEIEAEESVEKRKEESDLRYEKLKRKIELENVDSYDIEEITLSKEEEDQLINKEKEFLETTFDQNRKQSEENTRVISRLEDEYMFDTISNESIRTADLETASEGLVELKSIEEEQAEIDDKINDEFLKEAIRQKQYYEELRLKEEELERRRKLDDYYDQKIKEEQLEQRRPRVPRREYYEDDYYEPRRRREYYEDEYYEPIRRERPIIEDEYYDREPIRRPITEDNSKDETIRVVEKIVERYDDDGNLLIDNIDPYLEYDIPIEEVDETAIEINEKMLRNQNRRPPREVVNEEKTKEDSGIDQSILNNLSVVELKKLAKSMGLSGYSSMNKKELVTFIARETSS